MAGGRVDGKVDAGDRQAVRRQSVSGIGGMLCNSRACDVLRGRRGRRREKWETASVLWKESWMSGSPLPRCPYRDHGIFQSGLPHRPGPPVQRVWDCANHDGSYQTVAVSERQVLDGFSSHSSPTNCNPWMCGVEEGTSWRGEGGQGGFPDPSLGVSGVPNVPADNATSSLDPCPSVCTLHTFNFPIRTSLPSHFHHQNTTTPERHHRTNCSRRNTVLAGFPR